MNARRMMTRMVTTNQKKNTTIPGIAYPATVLALATASSYPAPNELSAAGVGSRRRPSQLHRQPPDALLIRPEHREYGNRDTRPDIVGDSRPNLGGAPDQEEFVDDRIGYRRQRTPAVTSLPGVPHGLQGRAAAEPALILGVDAGIQIGRHHPPGEASCRLPVRAGHDEEPGDDVGGGGPVQDERDHPGGVVRTEPVEHDAVALFAGQPQHSFPQGGYQEPRRARRDQGPPQAVDLEAVAAERDPISGERGAQEADGIPHPLVGLDEGGAVPLLNHVLAG